MDCRLKVLREAPVSVDPGEEAFDHPTPWQDDEADLIGLFPDDFDGDAGGRGHPLVIVSAIGPDELDEWKQGAGHLKQRPAAVTVLNVGGMGFHEQRPPVGVDERMALAAPSS